MEKRVWRGRHCCVSRFLFFFPVLNGLQFARRGERGNGGAKVSMLGVLGWRDSYTVDALRLDPLI